MVLLQTASLLRMPQAPAHQGTSLLLRRLFSSANPTGPPAFVFDIDGVLIRGKNVIPAAVQAMQELCVGGVWRFPVCFLTNGGGVLEAAKAEQLSRWLGVPVHANQVVLSHTPMRQLAKTALGRQVVLVVGRHDCPQVAASYGFSKVLSTSQLAAGLPGALPFSRGPPSAPPLAPAPGADPCPVRDLGWGSEEQPIAAVLVMADPDGGNWYQDLQLLTDVITSHGVPQRLQPLPGSRPVEVFFSNPDLLWAAEYPRPRFGQGAFSIALEALHRQVTGTPLPNTRFFGKPHPEPYRIAEQLLLEQLDLVQGQPPQQDAATAVVDDGHHQQQHQQGPETRPVSRVFSGIFAVGDNPAADVRGANNAGPPWVSVLVRTGVFQSTASNSESDPAHVVASDVLAAVHAGLHRARSSKWHSMR